MKLHKRSGGRINRSRGGNFMSLLFLMLLAAFMLLPMVFVVSNAFKPLEELFIYPPKLLVNNPTTDNFRSMTKLMSQSWVPFSRYLYNTVFLTVLGTLGHLIFASLAAYPLARHKFPGRNLIFNMIVLSLMFSGSVTQIPSYIIITKLGLLDSHLATLLPAIQFSLGLYLIKQFMEGLPDSVIEAARIDGASEWRIWGQIAMPMVKPAWLTLIILMIQNLWNTISPYTFSEELKTMPQALNQILSGGIARTGVSAAVSLIMLSVPVVTFILSQSQIIETMNSSGMKD
ncbi:MAG: carbohydrate ABC transporter permease [Clostridiales bacterium]|nr:carbohydrate ABC transporter permease [Clostridiales bacterium]